MPSSPNEVRARRVDSAIVIVAAVLLGLVYLIGSPGDFPLDDSWIHQTYARNLALHGEWAFITGEPSAASTSPLYTVVLAIGYALNIPFRLWTHGVGIAALAATGLVGVGLARRWFPKGRIALLCGLALVGSWHLIWSAVSGMETAIFNLLILLAIAWSWRELDLPTATAPTRTLLRGSVFGVIAGLTILARAEGVILIALLGIGLIPTLLRRAFGDLFLYGGAALIACALVLSPYLAFNIALTGGPLPDTAAAKRAYADPLFSTPLTYRLGLMLEPLIAGGQLLLLPGLIALAGFAGRERRPLITYTTILWPFALVGVYAAVLPLNFQHGRYVIPALPVAILFGAIGTALLVRAGRRSVIGRVLTRALALTTVAIFLVMAFTLGRSAYHQDVRIIQEEMVGAALWIGDNLPPDALLAIHDIGAVGYFAPRPLLDIAGLVTPEVVPLVGDPAQLWAFIEARGARYLMALEDQVPGDDVTDARLCPLYTSGQPTARAAGGSNMVVYALAFTGACP